MRFKLDENLPADLAEDLKAMGHDADTVPDEGLAGAEDSTVLVHALREGRILLTLDKGIASLVQHPTHSHAGVVLFRPDASGRKAILNFIRLRVADLLVRDLANRITIVSPQRIRIR